MKSGVLSKSKTTTSITQITAYRIDPQMIFQAMLQSNPVLKYFPFLNRSQAKPKLDRYTNIIYGIHVCQGIIMAEMHEKRKTKLFNDDRNIKPLSSTKMSDTEYAVKYRKMQKIHELIKEQFKGKRFSLQNKQIKILLEGLINQAWNDNPQIEKSNQRLNQKKKNSLQSYFFIQTCDKQNVQIFKGNNQRGRFSLNYSQGTKNRVIQQLQQQFQPKLMLQKAQIDQFTKQETHNQIINEHKKLFIQQIEKLEAVKNIYDNSFFSFATYDNDSQYFEEKFKFENNNQTKLQWRQKLQGVIQDASDYIFDKQYKDIQDIIKHLQDDKKNQERQIDKQSSQYDELIRRLYIRKPGQNEKKMMILPLKLRKQIIDKAKIQQKALSQSFESFKATIQKPPSQDQEINCYIWFLSTSKLNVSQKINLISTFIRDKDYKQKKYPQGYGQMDTDPVEQIIKEFQNVKNLSQRNKQFVELKTQINQLINFRKIEDDKIHYCFDELKQWLKKYLDKNPMKSDVNKNSSINANNIVPLNTQGGNILNMFNGAMGNYIINNNQLNNVNWQKQIDSYFRFQNSMHHIYFFMSEDIIRKYLIGKELNPKYQKEIQAFLSIDFKKCAKQIDQWLSKTKKQNKIKGQNKFCFLRINSLSWQMYIFLSNLFRQIMDIYLSENGGKCQWDDFGIQEQYNKLFFQIQKNKIQ